MTSPRSHIPTGCPARGFTLVELMISVAIAVLLILGVSQVFRIAGQTVGAGQALGTISRDDRTAHSVMWPDLHNAVLPTPAFNISSQRVFAFRNAADRAADTDGNASTVDLGGVSQPAMSATAVNDRSHRIDTLGFFASGDLYPRQTGAGTSFVAPTTSTEAWVWYGHLLLPNNAVLNGSTGAAFYGPGDADAAAPTGPNDNNRLAADWILGRVATLLVPTSTATPQDYYSIGGSKNPLAADAINPADGSLFLSSRYDQALTSIAKFASNDSGAAPATSTLAGRLAMAGTGYRFQANPFPRKPLNAAVMSQIAPIFLRNCSQFIVEYAGDYVTQSNNADASFGNVTATIPDREIDYVVDKSADPSGAIPALWVKKTRWYGFPRDINGDGHILVANDVVPLRDVYAAATPAKTTPASFEQFSANFPAAGSDYAVVGTVPDTASYICSWGPDNDPTNETPPKLIRITIALDDPNGRLTDPQVFEYVIDVQ